MFNHFFTSATLERMTRTDGKSSYSIIPGTIEGRLRPLSDTKDQILNEQFTNAYTFSTSIVEDIRKGDRLTINGEKYSVQGAEDHVGIRISFTRAVLQKG